MGAREDVRALRVLPGRGIGEQLWVFMQQEVGLDSSLSVHRAWWATVRVAESALRSIYAAIFARFRKQVPPTMLASRSPHSTEILSWCLHIGTVVAP